MSHGTVTVKGIATIDNVTLINVEGTGLVGVPGIASSIFTVVRDAGINVIMISQASSEQSICFAVRGADGDQAVKALQKRFESAISAGRIHAVQKMENCCVLAVVGAGMVNHKGAAATVMSALARASVNIKALASSECNTTLLIDQKDSEHITKILHCPHCKIKEQADQLRREFKIDIRVTGIASSKKMLLREKGIDLDNWQEEFDEHGAASICDASVRGTVGAGLPILSTLKHLVETGDKVTRIEGILSGTLSYIFNEYGDGRPFSEVVAAAKEQGYTEPDPRDDLNGTDVARKVVAAAKEQGYTEPDPRDDLNGTDVARKQPCMSVESLVPEPLRALKGGEEYMQRLSEFDAEMDIKLREAEE
eukprot:gene7186-293_t